MTAPTQNYQVETDANGSAHVRFEDGHHFALTDGDICAELASINAVGIKHLDEVSSHTINTIAGSRSHVIRFINGSLLNYAYNASGQLIELSSQSLDCRVSDTKKLLFYTAEQSPNA